MILKYSLMDQNILLRTEAGGYVDVLSLPDKPGFFHSAPHTSYDDCSIFGSCQKSGLCKELLLFLLFCSFGLFVFTEKQSGTVQSCKQMLGVKKTALIGLCSLVHLCLFKSEQ